MLAGNGPRRPASEVLSTASGFLLPLLVIAGVYIFVHGHLTPGGGFQGGVIVASAFLLLCFPMFPLELNHRLLIRSSRFQAPPTCHRGARGDLPRRGISGQPDSARSDEFGTAFQRGSDSRHLLAHRV